MASRYNVLYAIEEYRSL